MYWPVGAPRVYSADQFRVPDENVTVSEESVSDDSDAVLVSKNGSVAEDQTSGGDEGQGQDTTSDGVSSPSHIICLRVTRNGHLFATLSQTDLTIWQVKPLAVVAAVVRSEQSLKTYGNNANLLLRPDLAIFVIQTTRGYLITYSLATDPDARLYTLQYAEGSGGGHNRRQSLNGLKSRSEPNVGPGEGHGIFEVSIRFRMVIKVDAGISRAMALDDELIVATQKPAAVQCIRWAPDGKGSQTSTELLSRMPWMEKKASMIDMLYDRPMNLSTWVTDDGKAYAVQRLTKPSADEAKRQALFRGYPFHKPDSDATAAVKCAINARFSLIAVGCADGSARVYTARDYMGHIPLSHILRPTSSLATTGQLTFLSYSPDGYCLFAGYENGWMMWSVYGKPGASSFTCDRALAAKNDETWLLGVQDGFWIGGGAELLLLARDGKTLWRMEMARHSVAGCFTSANVSRSLLQTGTGFSLYRGYDVPDLTSISADQSLWHSVQVPAQYLSDQWPIRSAVTSNDGRYIAIAGRRGLAHYSMNSGRWKTFDDPVMEADFTVRGGMCWHQHVLIAAVETSTTYEIRLYSRELPLDNNRIAYVERMSAPVVLIAPSGDDSLLVYSYENILYHYIIDITSIAVKLVQVGQIALHGIIRAPPRVRALSWILPDDQMDHGDPSRDVAVATILFLVDGKLVLLQPSQTDNGELKYDMRIIAQNVEYYALMRDHPAFSLGPEDPSAPQTPSGGALIDRHSGQNLGDSLWYFDGYGIKVWVDVQDFLSAGSAELGREAPNPVHVAVDFYPLSILLNKGVVFGVEPELLQRRDGSFAVQRFATRTHLFLPPVLRYHLSHFDSPAALHLSHYYQALPYFAHALEVLLHDVLDEEVDSPPPADQALLPTVLSFISSFPQYLDIVVQCTRKTEVRSWRTLFAHLPPPKDLFEDSLRSGSLKTAGGYLLVLHTLEELGHDSDQVVRLLQRAREEDDWELCKELARFLMALDESGLTLRRTLESVELKTPVNGTSRYTPATEYSTRVQPSQGEMSGVHAGLLGGARNGDVNESPRSPGSVRLQNGTRDYFPSDVE